MRRSTCCCFRSSFRKCLESCRHVTIEDDTARSFDVVASLCQFPFTPAPLLRCGSSTFDYLAHLIHNFSDMLFVHALHAGLLICEHAPCPLPPTLRAGRSAFWGALPGWSHRTFWGVHPSWCHRHTPCKLLPSPAPPLLSRRPALLPHPSPAPPASSKVCVHTLTPALSLFIATCPQPISAASTGLLQGTGWSRSRPGQSSEQAGRFSAF